MSEHPHTATPPRPTPHFLLSHPAHFIALGAGSGLSRIAPGTIGTLWAWLSFIALQHWVPPAFIGWIIALSLPVGWWACTLTTRDMGTTDPGCIVWDEVIAFWLILWLVTPASWLMQCTAFALFRFFDAVKPQPVAWADGLFKQRGAAFNATHWWRAGFGILFDDLVAAFCTLLLIALWRAG